MPIQTMLDVARLREADPVVGLIQENIAAAPELAILPARYIPGTNYKTAVISGQSSGAFRPANQGVALTAASIRQELVQCFYHENPIEIDAAIDYASQGYSIGQMSMIVAAQKMLSTMQNIGRQVWYGTATDSNGFAGCKQFTPKVAVTGSSSIFIDATGTTANTASSVYAVKFGLQNVSMVFGANTDFTMGPFIDQQLTDASNRKYMGRVSSIAAWVGLQIGNANCVGRIGNITRDSGKTLTDTLLSQLVAAFGVGFEPDAIFMSRRSAQQLAASRPRTGYFTPGTSPKATVTGTTYTVTDYEGIPVYRTDQILDTDAIE